MKQIITEYKCPFCKEPLKINQHGKTSYTVTCCKFRMPEDRYFISLELVYKELDKLNES